MPLAFPDLQDVGVVARFERWGYPWHGLATSGSLDTSTHTIIQPTGGDTYVQRFPGVPALSLPPAQIAADALVGMQWLDYLILSGKNQQIYGAINLGPLGWIYGSTDGTRWWIKVTSGTTVSGNSATFTFSVVRFGEFNSTPETYTRSVTVSDLGQSTPTLTFESAIEPGSSGYSCSATDFQLDLDDIKPDGSEAVIALRSNCPAGLISWTPSWWAGERVPLGFLRVSVTDGMAGPTVSVSVLHDRTTTLGTFDDSPLGASWHVTDRIIGVWYDADGVPVPVKFDHHCPYVVDSQGYSGAPAPWSETYNASADAYWTWALSWGAVSGSVSMAVHEEQSVSCSRASESDPVICSATTYSSFDFAGLIAGTTNYSGSWDTTLASAETGLGFGFHDWTLTSGRSSTIPQAYIGSGIAEPVIYQAGVTYGGDMCAWVVKRLANKYFALLAMKFPAGSDIPPVDQYAAWSQTNDMVLVLGFGPGGSDTANTGALGILSNIVPTVTVKPVTNVPYLKPGGLAVCYV